MRSTVRLPWGEVSYLHWAPDGQPRATVILLHGAGVDTAELSWGELGPRLAAQGYRVLAPDHPGCGHSPAPPWQWTQDRLVGYVGDFVAALVAERYVIGGLSLGGGLALGHVLSAPENVCGAMLLASYGMMRRVSDGPCAPVRQVLAAALVRGVMAAGTQWLATRRTVLGATMATLIRDPRRRTPALLDQVYAAARAGRGLDVVAQWQREQIGWTRLATDYTHRLPSVGVPVLIVAGSRDTGVPVARARAAAQLIPDARLEVLNGAGHWLQRDRPDEVFTAMLMFLAAVV